MVRVAGKGMPKKGGRGGFGDLYLTFEVDFPDKLTDFRAMFYRSGMREQRQTYKQPILSNQLVPMQMPDISLDVFLQVLEFLYTDSVENMTDDISIPLLIVSERF